MLFDGESKRRLVSSSGRKRDVSRNSVIEESRKQREQRLLEKQRMLSAIVIQKYIRRYLKQKKTQLECLEFLNQQLTTISRIQLVLPNFCLPLETVIVLLKYSVFSQAIAKGFENWKKSISLLTRSFQSCDSVGNLSSSLEKVNAHSFQILLSSFLESLFPFVSSLNHRVFIFEFLSTLLRLMQDLDLNHGSLFLKCIRGAIGILRHKPYQLLQKISFLSNQTEMQNLFVLLLKVCEIGLYDGDSPANSLLLGYFPPEVHWNYFTKYILCIPNLFENYWGLTYLCHYSLPNQCHELSHSWLLALSSLKSCDLTLLETISLCSNFCFVVSNTPELLIVLPSHLWSDLLARATHDDYILQSAVLNYHDVHLSKVIDDDDHEGSFPFLKSPETLEQKIKHCQMISSPAELDHLTVQLTSKILNIALQPAFLRSWVATISNEISNFTQYELDVIILFSKLLAFTPPEYLLGSQITARSIPSSLRVLLYDSPKSLFQKLWINADFSKSSLHTNVDSHISRYGYYFYFFLFLVWNQLLTMDDIEFLESIKCLTIDQFISLGLCLKDHFYLHLWTLDTVDQFLTSGLTNSTSVNFFNIQIVSIGSKVFNNLITRNERLKYCSSEIWTWNVFAPSEFEVKNDIVIEETEFPVQSTRLKHVLEMVPQVIPFILRARLFQHFLEFDKNRVNNSLGSSPLRIEIRRDFLIQSAFEQLYHLRNELKRNVKVTFVNSSGLQESGIDGGGLFKEFIDDLMKEMCQDRWGFFRETSDHRLVPNPIVETASSEYLQYYVLLGCLLGKAIYENILVEPIFAGMFLNLLLGRINLIDDLPSLDEQIYRNLLQLKRNYLYGNSDISQLGLTFEVNRESSVGMNHVYELITNGSNTIVTKSNLLLYIFHYANFKLNIEASQQCRAFLSGFRSIIPIKWIRIFSSQELQLIIGGDTEKPFDLEALKKHCTYSGGYHPSQPYIQEFWKIIESFPSHLQREFLRFVTSCSRQPILGFDQLNPPFNIMKIPTHLSGETASRLPMASACFNQFKLPQYDSVEELREKLLYAIQSKSGFELT